PPRAVRPPTQAARNVLHRRDDHRAGAARVRNGRARRAPRAAVRRGARARERDRREEPDRHAPRQGVAEPHRSGRRETLVPRRAGLHLRAQPVGRQRRAPPGVRRQARRATARQLTMNMPKRRFWGWGVEGAGPTREQQEKMGETIAARFGADPRTPIDPPTIDELDLRAPRVAPPESLAHLCTTEPEERAGHTYGKSFRDVWR